MTFKNSYFDCGDRAESAGKRVGQAYCEPEDHEETDRHNPQGKLDITDDVPHCDLPPTPFVAAKAGFSLVERSEFESRYQTLFEKPSDG